MSLVISFRYGWSFATENKNNEPPSPSTPGTGKQMCGSENPLTMMSSPNQVTDTPPLENLPPDGQVESTVCLVKNVFFSLVLDSNHISQYTRDHNYFCLSRRIR